MLITCTSVCFYVNKPTFFTSRILSTSTQCLNTSSCQFIGLRKAMFFFHKRSRTGPWAESWGFVITVLSLPLHFSVCVFCWYWNWQPLSGGRGFEPGGSSLYQRLIATSEWGTAPKKTFTAVKRGLAPNDLGQLGFFTARAFTGMDARDGQIAGHKLSAAPAGARSGRTLIAVCLWKGRSS